MTAGRTRPLVRLRDGTVKQVSPVTGTVVWTVPGRANRPLAAPSDAPRPVDPAERDRLCAFCSDRYLETPPEKARMVTGPDGAWVLCDVPAEHLDDTVAELRRIPNLFEILSTQYWRANHGFDVPGPVLERFRAYTSTPRGRDHVLSIVRRRLAAQGIGDDEWAAQDEQERLAAGIDLFAGSHDVVVARRHLVDGARYDDELAGSGTLTPDEHHRYVAFTVDTMRDLYQAQPHARYVAAFQNWLRPAGASFDHLHKQLVAIDEHGPRVDHVLATLRREPDVFAEVLRHAARNGLLVAENDHAVALAGVGHRYPSFEVYSTSTHRLPWEHTDDEIRAVSDLLHALHAATGPRVATNEEWHHRPPGAVEPMPWHVVLKWRVSTLAGFEGGTKIYVNTLDPATLRDRAVTALRRLAEAGEVAPMRVGTQCRGEPGALGRGGRV